MSPSCSFPAVFRVFGRFSFHVRRSRAIFRSRPDIFKIFSRFRFMSPTYLVHMPSGVTNMNSVFQFSHRIPPRTPLKGRKIFWLGFFRNSPRRCISASWVWIWNQNFKFPSRSRLIRVFVSDYYVKFRFLLWNTCKFTDVRGRVIFEFSVLLAE